VSVTTQAEGKRTDEPRPAGSLHRISAQCLAELEMTARRGESVLLTLGIPVVLLVFFSAVHALPTGDGNPIAFLAPGILSLAVMSTAMVNLGIATGFERGYGVLKRLGTTPLGRPALLAAKTGAILVVEMLQFAVLVPISVGLGWHPAGGAAVALVVVLLGTSAFAGIGLALAGSLRAEVNLAAANGLWLVMLLVSGMLVPLARLPGWLEGISKFLPSAAITAALHGALGTASAVPAWSWITLSAWALLAPVVAAATFRWE
jgi:ABC-2 type transport system permease protein